MDAPWRSWYVNGATFDSVSNVVSDLPLDGCLIIMVWQTGGGRTIMEGTEYYFHADGDVWGQAESADYPGGEQNVRDGIAARYTGSRVLRGKDVSTNTMQRVRAAAYASKKPE